MIEQDIQPGEQYLVEADPEDVDWEMDTRRILYGGGNVTLTVGGCAVLTLLAADYEKHPWDQKMRHQLRMAGVPSRTPRQIDKVRRAKQDNDAVNHDYLVQVN